MAVFPWLSAVALIIERMNDWYLSGSTSPAPSTTVTAPMLPPGRIYMLSQAMEMSAPADAAVLSMNATTGTGQLSMRVRIESAASTAPPYVLMCSTITSAPSWAACSMPFFIMRHDVEPISLSMGMTYAFPAASAARHAASATMATNMLAKYFIFSTCELLSPKVAKKNETAAQCPLECRIATYCGIQGSRYQGLQTVR